MAKSEKDDFNFDDFQYSGVKLTPSADFTKDLPTEEHLAEEQIGATAEISAAPAEPVAAVEPEDKKAKKKAKKEKKPKEKKQKPVVQAAEGERAKSTLGKRLSEASPYTVMLGVTLAALLLAVVFLLIELSRYQFDVKASTAKGIVMIESPLLQEANRWTARFEKTLDV
jgi:hypothetical protein